MGCIPLRRPAAPLVTFVDIPPKEDIDDKHKKYMAMFPALQAPLLEIVHTMNRGESFTEFWGIGIENETYLQLGTLRDAASFRTLLRKRERYSVDYYANFQPAEIERLFTTRLHRLDTLTYPIYVNAHSFQRTDPLLRHRTFYDHHQTPNPTFTESIHDHLVRECPFYRNSYEKSVVFDGDSIEFITQNFYRTTVEETVKELETLKTTWLRAVDPFFAQWFHGDHLHFPSHSFGLVSFLSTGRKQVTPCNNSTYHVNLTLPTLLDAHGKIVHPDEFLAQHLRVAEAIQVVEPLLVACYGTPDVFSVLDPDRGYAQGSLRVALSRYISLQTYDTSPVTGSPPLTGKQLVHPRPQDPSMWYNRFHDAAADSPYRKNESIGFDINLLKFRNHGIELRFFDGFPEMYLTGVMQFLVLLATHAVCRPAVCRPTVCPSAVSRHRDRYSSLVCGCVRYGHTYRLTEDDLRLLVEDLSLPLAPLDNTPLSGPYEVLCSINRVLYDRYRDHPIVAKMCQPLLRPPTLVNYNREAYEQLRHDLFGPPILLIRSEENPLESRTPLMPEEVARLMTKGIHVWVERSPYRCVHDLDYERVGCRLVDRGHGPTHWNAAHVVLGIKGLPDDCPVLPAHQTHFFFAHCFNGQPHARETLRPFSADACLIDYETLRDGSGKRVVSFGSITGTIGASMALMAYFRARNHAQDPFPPYSREVYHGLFQTFDERPRVLVIGYGIVGQQVCKTLEEFGVEYTVWGHRHDTALRDNSSRDSIRFEYDVVIVAIRIHPEEPAHVWLTTEDLDVGSCQQQPSRRLSVICDISCDLGHPCNSLPIYDTFTTPSEPCRRIRSNPPLDLIALPYLPALDPVTASTAFSRQLIPYLMEAPFPFPYRATVHGTTREAEVIGRSRSIFLEKRREILGDPVSLVLPTSVTGGSERDAGQISPV